ncbi:hypothetical protein ACYAFJ_004832, partial [Pseudomonas aeruginosa]
QSQYEASFEEWLANELEGEDGQPVPAAVCDITLARRAFNHWPKLEQPAKVGGVRFSAGVSSRLVVEAAQRLYEFESTPEQEAERPEVVAYRTIGRHTKHQHPHYALNYYKQNAEDQAAHWRERGCEVSEDELMTVAQHDRIVGAVLRQKHEADTALAWATRHYQTVEQQRDAALARVAEMEKELAMARDAASKGDAARHAACGMEMDIQELKAKLAELERHEPVSTQHLPMHIAYARAKREVFLGSCQEDVFRFALIDLLQEFPLYTAPVAQAQHSVPEGYALIPTRETEAMHDAVMALLYKGVARTDTQKLLDAYIAAAPGKEVPQAWHDVQAERRRQIEAEGWTPEHDDEHDNGEMALAAASYAAYAHIELSGDLPFCWPWDQQWWKPKSSRENLVRAGALVLAEIERLDRAAASQGGPSDA